MDILKLKPNIQEAVIRRLSEHLTASRVTQIEQVLERRTRHITLVPEDVYQAHNAAAVVRSCECFGIQDLHIIENRNPFNLEDKTVAKGANKWLDIEYYQEPDVDNTTVCLKGLKDRGYRIAATTLGKETVSIEEVPLDEPLAVVIGTEKAGLTEKACADADYFVRIPMYGFTQSFNLSVCAGICLYTLARRMRESKVKWQLTEDEKLALKYSWLSKCVKHSEEVVSALLKEL